MQESFYKPYAYVENTGEKLMGNMPLWQENPAYSGTWSAHSRRNDLLSMKTGEMSVWAKTKAKIIFFAFHKIKREHKTVKLWWYFSQKLCNMFSSKWCGGKLMFCEKKLCSLSIASDIMPEGALYLVFYAKAGERPQLCFATVLWNKDTCWGLKILSSSESVFTKWH